MLQQSILNFQFAGKGPNLLLLHGFCEDSTIWNNFIPELSRNYCVIIPDLLGFGNSEYLKSSSIEEMSDSVCLVLQKMGARQFVVVGHSMGGYVALALAEKHPDAVKGLMLFHSTSLSDCDQKRKDRETAIGSIKQYGTRPFLSGFFNKLFRENNTPNFTKIKDELKSRTMELPAEGIINAINAMMIRPDRSCLLKHLTCPIGFIAGDQDEFLPLSKTIEESSYPDTSVIHILRGAGHAGMFEQYDETLKMVSNFTKFCYEVA